MTNDRLSDWKSGGLRVLLLPPTSRDAKAIEDVLAREQIACLLCPTLQSLCAEIDRGAGAVIVSEEALRADSSSLVQCLHSQPVWSDLPVIILSRSGSESMTASAALANLGNASVLERPVRMSTLISVVRFALRAREKQYQVRDHLVARETSDAALRQSREQLELVVRGAKVGVWQCPLPFDRLSWDETVKSHFHLSQDADVTIETFYERLDPADREPVREAIGTSLAKHEPFDVDYRTVSPDGGDVKWIRAMGSVSLDANGAPVRFSGITLDITDRKTAEERRSALLDAERAARTGAERASQMKDEFLATLSHELRTPLNAILGWAQLLKTPSLAAENLDEGLAIIERNARAQAQIIEDLLDMSRIISGKVRLDVQPLDLDAVVRAAVETVQPAATAKGIRVRTVLDPLLAPIAGDPNRLQQVFWNLISNAVKFTPKGGEVQVVLQRVDSQLEVSISDNGEGIDPAFLPSVFDRFRQADASASRAHGGLGLGLAIVKQLVELHGGTIRAESPGKGQGAKFIVSLPTFVSYAPRELPPERRHPKATTTKGIAYSPIQIAGLKVLVVDDEPDARALLARLLADQRVEVYAAQTTDEAIELIQSKRPDVVVSDIGMPGEDGYSFIRRVRNLPTDAGGKTPAVALTAYARAEDRINAMVAGFQHHLSKPVEPAELIAVVASLAGRASVR